MSEKLAAEQVMGTLRAAGYEAYLVGGVVRDLMLGLEPHDYDVTTDATPEQITPLFEKTIPVGAAFGVVVAVVNDEQIQVATYRADGDYSDGRRPDTVKFSETAREDVERRDFTMNGLLVMPDHGRSYENTHPDAHVQLFNDEPWDNVVAVIDYVGGIRDIKAKVIRCIGDPVKRFTEDALRKMRAVRFAAKLGFEIEADTFKAICADPSLTNISRERITEELLKLLTSPDPVKGLVPLMTSGLFREIFGKYTDYFRMQDTLVRFTQSRPDSPEMALAMLLVDCDGVRTNAATAENLLESIFASLVLTKKMQEEVSSILSHQVCLRFVSNFPRSYAIRTARAAGVVKIGTRLFEQSVKMGLEKEDKESISFLRSLTEEDLRPKLLLTGIHLIEAGFTPSPVFSRILTAVEDEQLNGTITTTEQALTFARSFMEVK